MCSCFRNTSSLNASGVRKEVIYFCLYGNLLKNLFDTFFLGEGAVSELEVLINFFHNLIEPLDLAIASRVAGNGAEILPSVINAFHFDFFAFEVFREPLGDGFFEEVEKAHFILKFLIRKYLLRIYRSCLVILVDILNKIRFLIADKSLKFFADE